MIPESVMDSLLKVISRDLNNGHDVHVELKREPDEDDFDEEDLPFCDGDCENCDEYCDEDEEDEEPMMFGIPDVSKIVFNPPATIVFWSDGEKTVVKCAEGQAFERYAGFCAAVCKRLFGSTAAAKEFMESVDEENWKLWQEEEERRRREAQLALEQKAHEEKAKRKEISVDQLVDAFIEALKRCALGGTKE